jgi:hypothetical protein
MGLHSTLLILVALIGSVASCVGGQDLEARLEKSLRDASSISNVEVRMVDVLWIKDYSLLEGKPSDGVAFSRTFEYYYLAFGRKYRTSCKLLSGTRTNLAKHFESAFDGTTYVCYDADQRYMTKSHSYQRGDRGECQNGPLVAPFMFLSRVSDDCPSCTLRFSDVVAPDFTNGLMLPRGQESDGLLHISMPGHILVKQPTLWSICIDKTGESFTPRVIRWAIPGGAQETIYKLLNYTNVGTYQFPATIAWTASSYPPTSPPSVIATGMTTLVSIRMPKQVAGSAFLLNEDSAVRIWDSDQKTFTKSGPGSVHQRLPPP